MKTKYILQAFLLLAMVFAGKGYSFAQTDPLERLWYNEAKVAKIQVYKAVDGRFYGKIAWLKEPNKDGKPKVDYNNPDKNRQNDPLFGLLILKGFKKDGDNGYDDGTIYDPKNGKTYKCKMTLADGVLQVRGYIGFSFIGRTETWTKAE